MPVAVISLASFSSFPQTIGAGGMAMNAMDYWRLFLETGAPELYLLYSNARNQEEPNVSDDPGHRPAGHRLQ